MHHPLTFETSSLLLFEIDCTSKRFETIQLAIKLRARRAVLRPIDELASYEQFA